MTTFFPELVPENGGPSQQINAAMLIYRRFFFNVREAKPNTGKIAVFLAGGNPKIEPSNIVLRGNLFEPSEILKVLYKVRFFPVRKRYPFEFELSFCDFCFFCTEQERSKNP